LKSIMEVRIVKKKPLVILLALILVTSSLFGACATPAPEVIELSYSNFFPPTHFHSILAEEWVKEIEKRTDGRVKINYFPGGSLTPAPKVYSTGVGAKIMEALGAEGYGASQGEAYDLMAKGTIDGSFTPREVLKGWNQAEVVKYVTGCYDVGNTANMFVVMNKDKWSALPEEIKTIIAEVSQEWIEKHGMVWDYYDKAGIDYFLTFAGREVIELSSEEMAKWVEAAVDPLIDTYISEKTAMGLPATDYQEYLLAQVSYWSGRSPTAAESVAWVEAELEPLVPAG